MNEYLASWIPDDGAEKLDETVVRQWIAKGESETLEFKSSLRWDRKEGRVNKDLERVVVKTLAGLLNAKKGGALLVGVADSGEVSGPRRRLRITAKEGPRRLRASFPTAHLARPRRLGVRLLDRDLP